MGIVDLFHAICSHHFVVENAKGIATTSSYKAPPKKQEKRKPFMPDPYSTTSSLSSITDSLLKLQARVRIESLL